MDILLVSPSILSANFLNLERDVNRLEAAGADSIHIDIMDGVFVSNTTWGPSTVAAIREITSLPLDVHLMIDKPERLIDDYLRTNVDCIIIHPESTIFLRKTLLKIKEHGTKVGVALKLETPIDIIENCFDLVDVILIITCDEGFGGQSFHPLSLGKISKVIERRFDYGLTFEVIVDGGINPETGNQCKEVGADVLVAGSYVFSHEMKTAINLLRNI